MTNNIKDVEIKRATREDIKLFYPDGPPRTSYSWLVLYKGVPACLAGVIMERGGCIAYSEMKEGNYPKKAIWLTAKALLENIKSVGVPLYAICEKESARSQAFVERLGFHYKRIHDGKRLYLWQ